MENKSNNNKKHPEPKRGKVKKFFSRYGIAVALFACAAIVAGTWLFTDGNIFGAGKATPAPTGTKSLEANAGQQGADAMRTTTPAPTVASTAAPKLMPDLVKPVKGNLSKKFAYDSLVYMKTLNQWSTHFGVDISGKVGDDVVAALSGAVDSVYKDPMLGNCIKIKSSDVICVYGGLLKADSAKKGDSIEAGEVIGQIGNTAASESSEDPHLHFEVWVKGVPANPEPYFTK